MVRAYHVVFCTYGFWLPNDPRGSWSEFVRCWALAPLGQATKPEPINQRRSAASDAHNHWLRRRQQEALQHPPVEFTGQQARAVARGFRHAIRRSGFVCFACAVLPQHVHAVFNRPRYAIDYVIGQLKAEATKQLLREGLHPFQRLNPPPSPWSRKGWHTFLNDAPEVCQAIKYVEANPMKENKPPQRWSFVTPFEG